MRISAREEARAYGQFLASRGLMKQDAARWPVRSWRPRWFFPEKFRHRKLNDSKQLAPELREEIYHELIANAEIAWAVGMSIIEIDRSIFCARPQGDAAAIDALLEPPDHVLIDGLPVIPFPLPQTAIVDGDCYSLTIAAASVIAKVTRDTMMRDFCAAVPGVLLQPAQRLRHRTAPDETS